MSASRLSDLVAQAMADNTEDGRCNSDAAKAALIGRLTDEHRERAVAEFATRLINQAASRVLKEFASTSAAQGVLPFRLHSAYAMDIDGRRIVSTYDMSRLEANRALEIRRSQIEADTRSANDLERAIRAADPFWNRDAALTFGAALERAAATYAATLAETITASKPRRKAAA